MGTFYRSRHELIFAFKKGTAPASQQFRARPAWPLPRPMICNIRGVNTLKTGRLTSFPCIRR